MAEPSFDPKLICPSSSKAEIEVVNQQEVLEYIQDFVTKARTRITESDVLEIHRLTISGIYPCAGNFRTATTEIQITGSTHKPAHPALVRSGVSDMLDWHYGPVGQAKSVFLRAARMMWKVCSIHPFNGGNGRVARALAYLIIVSEAAPLFAGEPLPLKLKKRKSKYLSALKAADRGPLDQMEMLVFECVIEQLDDVAKELNRDAKEHGGEMTVRDQKVLGAFANLAGRLVEFVKGSQSK